jgi:dissimilatory sulfite reductase (desulfoviridin) alpha/beta subunit
MGVAMRWTPQAETAVGKVPFFVRKRVRARVEKEAAAEGKQVVTLKEVQATQTRFLTQQQHEIKGYQVECCFGPSGCPNRAVVSDDLAGRVTARLQEADLLNFLKVQVGAEKLKYHHEFRVTIADCPNACSQPQIKDVGIIGAVRPIIGRADCEQCQGCVDVCKEDAVTLQADGEAPDLDLKRCMACGQCVAVCPTGTLQNECIGYRIVLGGKLGRHPRLARELPGIYSSDQVLKVLMDCLNFYKTNSCNGSRFGEVLTEGIFAQLTEKARGMNQPRDNA